ncbi:hypothetical protein DL765_007584 [Monosporascus sp. GIB2]|nr:hypothetical protein DL765_007584 [Monosporascus sp. GIB2]
MTPLPGGCYCGAVRYTITLDDPHSQARTSICHCGNCKKFTGGEHGITTKIPKSAFEIKQGRDQVRVHEADNGSGTLLHREFCGTCGGPLLEYGANAGDNIYVFYGTMEDHARAQVQPKGEFFGKLRDPWMPEIQAATSLKACPAAEDSFVNLVKVESTVDTDAEAAVEAVQAQRVEQLDIVITNVGISNVFARVEDIDLKDPREMSGGQHQRPRFPVPGYVPPSEEDGRPQEPGAPRFVTTFVAIIQNLKDNPPFLLGFYGASKVALNYLVCRRQLETEWPTSFSSAILVAFSHSFIETDMANTGAKFFGMDQAVVPVKLDEASCEKTAGRLLSYNGTEISY